LDQARQAETLAWMFAALNSVEPQVQQLAAIDLFYAKEDWAQERRPGVVKAVEKRLDDLAKALDGREWLLDRFTAGDLMMVAVLRILRHTDIVEQRPALLAYRQRGEERSAHVRAVAAQMADFAESDDR
jgi:glutathione S-transferase